MYVLKRQRIFDPHNLNDTAYRELRVFQRLRVLEDEGKCFNFIRLIDWFKEKRDDENVEQQFMDFVLELADEVFLNFLYWKILILKPLHKVKEMNIREYKMICFQLVWALYIAQKETEFVHWFFNQLQYSC